MMIHVQRYIETAVRAKMELKKVGHSFKCSVRVGPEHIAHMGPTEVSAQVKVMEHALNSPPVVAWAEQLFIEQGKAFLKSLDELLHNVNAFSPQGMRFLRFDMPPAAMETLRASIDSAHMLLPDCTHPIQQLGEFRFTFQGVEVRIVAS